MPIAKKDRFMDTNLRIVIGDSEHFPPETFFYNDQEFIVLGSSNKQNLIPVNIDNTELQQIVTFGGLSQFICTDASGNIYDACFYKQGNQTMLFAISTREKPEKAKEKKEEEPTQ